MRRFSCFALVAVLTAGGLAMAQQTGSIDGTVRDAQGLVMPGVTVTLASPALQVGQRVVTTGPDGSYRFGELPGGPKPSIEAVAVYLGLDLSESLFPEIHQRLTL